MFGLFHSSQDQEPDEPDASGAAQLEPLASAEVIAVDFVNKRRVEVELADVRPGDDGGARWGILDGLCRLATIPF